VSDRVLARHDRTPKRFSQADLKAFVQQIPPIGITRGVAHAPAGIMKAATMSLDPNDLKHAQT
jgi:hypothetical protein